MTINVDFDCFMVKYQKKDKITGEQLKKTLKRGPRKGEEVDEEGAFPVQQMSITLPDYLSFLGSMLRVNYRLAKVPMVNGTVKEEYQFSVKQLPIGSADMYLPLWDTLSREQKGKVWAKYGKPYAKFVGRHDFVSFLEKIFLKPSTFQDWLEKHTGKKLSPVDTAKTACKMLIELSPKDAK